MPDVFLLHFDPPYRHARHYLGYAVGTGRGHDYARRIARGVALGPHELVQAAQWNECTITVADVWPGEGRALQRRLRAQGGLSRHCRLCRESGVYHR
jgi:hypothetical protein